MAASSQISQMTRDYKYRLGMISTLALNPVPQYKAGSYRLRLPNHYGNHAPSCVFHSWFNSRALDNGLYPILIQCDLQRCDRDVLLKWERDRSVEWTFSMNTFSAKVKHYTDTHLKSSTVPFQHSSAIKMNDWSGPFHSILFDMYDPFFLLPHLLPVWLFAKPLTSIW